MDVYVYVCEDSPEVVRKTLKSEKKIEGTYRGAVNIFAPDVFVSEDVTGYNYMYIPAFSRYYYINGSTIARTGLYQVTDIKEDVLMSLADKLADVPAIIDKSELLSYGNEFIDDGSFITSSKKIHKVYNYGYGFNDDPDFFLITAGAYM